jgi:RNA recognition motif-containing protein
MKTKLYVGGLSYGTTSQGLEVLFSEAGTVNSAKVISDRDTGRSKGFGFVEMGSNEEAAAAIAKFHGSSVDGRTLTVNEARENNSRGGFGRGAY